jgi:hypothetical protein
VAPGVEAKRPELRVAGVLRDEPDPEWAPVLDQVAMRGFPLSNEVVFFHRPSATLEAAYAWLPSSSGADAPSERR